MKQKKAVPNEFGSITNAKYDIQSLIILTWVLIMQG